MRIARLTEQHSLLVWSDTEVVLIHSGITLTAIVITAY